MRVVVILSALLLASCATKERIVVQKVSVPVGVPCKVKIPDAPPYAVDDLDLNASIFDKAKALLAEREQRKAREAELEAAARSCS
jgi:hypothetical protein